MKGYLNKPEVTKKYLRIVDRTKDMIIVGGIRSSQRNWKTP